MSKGVGWGRVEYIKCESVNLSLKFVQLALTEKSRYTTVLHLVCTFDPNF